MMKSEIYVAVIYLIYRIAITEEEKNLIDLQRNISKEKGSYRYAAQRN